METVDGQKRVLLSGNEAIAHGAIAAGCTVVLKPAEDTPFSALALCQVRNNTTQKKS